MMVLRQSKRGGGPMRRQALILLMLTVLASRTAQAQCSAELCATPTGSLGALTAGQGNLLDALINSLTGASVNLPLATQQVLADSTVNVSGILKALQDSGLGG